MKILWITIESILPANSGGRIGIFRRLEQISKNNDVYLFYTMDSLLDKIYQEELKRYCVEVHGYLRRKKSFSTMVKLFMAPFTVASRYNPEMILGINECIKNNGIDLINVDSPHMGLNLYKITHYGIPIVLNQHNIEWMVYQNIANSNSSIIKKVLYYLESIRFKHFEDRLYKKELIDMMTFVSTEDMEYINTNYNYIKTELIPVGGMSKEYLYDWKNKNNNTILFVGKMSYAPNAEAAKWFIKFVLPKIKKEVPTVRFIVVGRDPDDELKSLESDNVVITGMVDSVDKYYKNASLVVIPLKHGGGVKIKLLEALGNKIPIVSTSVGLQGTVFNAMDFLRADTCEDFADKCIMFLNHKEQFQRNYENVFLLFDSNYTWSTIGKKYNQVLQNVKNNFDKV